MIILCNLLAYLQNNESPLSFTKNKTWEKESSKHYYRLWSRLNENMISMKGKLKGYGRTTEVSEMNTHRDGKMKKESAKWSEIICGRRCVIKDVPCTASLPHLPTIYNTKSTMPSTHLIGYQCWRVSQPPFGGQSHLFTEYYEQLPAGKFSQMPILFDIVTPPPSIPPTTL